MRFPGYLPSPYPFHNITYLYLHVRVDIEIFCAASSRPWIFFFAHWVGPCYPQSLISKDGRERQQRRNKEAWARADVIFQLYTEWAAQIWKSCALKIPPPPRNMRATSPLESSTLKFCPSPLSYGSTSWKGAILAPPPQKRETISTQKTGWKQYHTGAKIVYLFDTVVPFSWNGAR